MWFALALIVATVAVYAPVRHYDFVAYDDPRYLNPHVIGGLTWEGVSWAFTTGYFSNWHPLTWLSHMLDVQMYGMNAGGHHITNVILHIANTLLLLGLLHRMTGKLGRSAFVAALFAVHPLHVESVAWVSERKDVLSTLFAMLTLWGYIWYVQRPRLGRYLAVLLFFGLGLMAKPMLVTLPFVLLLLDVWPLDRIPLRADSSARLGWTLPGDRRPAAVRLVWEKLPLLALTLASSIVTFIVQRWGGAVGALDAVPLDFRVANALVSYVAYIVKTVWPVRLSALYPYPESLPGWWAVGSMFALIAVSAAVIRAAHHRPYLPVGWLWYVGMLVPVIGLVQVGNQAMADRYTYVPLVGLFIVAAWGIPDLLTRWPYQRTLLRGASVLVIAACAMIARGQVRHWENSTSLWGNALAVTSGNYLAHNNLGVVLVGQGKLLEGAAHYAEALRINPAFAESHNNLAIVLTRQGRIGEAIAQYTEALRLQPDSAEAHNNLGVVLKNQGRVNEAIAHYTEALRFQPDYANAHYNLGNVLLSQGRTDEAIGHYTAALEINPTNQRFRSALEELKSRAGRVGSDGP